MCDAHLSTNTMISRFLNSYDSSTRNGAHDLWGVLESIKGGLYEPEITYVRQVLARYGKPAYDRAKAQLPAFTFGGLFFPKRGNAYLQQHSGLVHVDLDDLHNVKAVKHTLASDPRVVYVFVSPGGTGLKAGVRVPIVPDNVDYRHAWLTVKAEFETLYGVTWDESGKDVARLCFVSFDPEAFWNPDALCFEVPPPPLPTPRPATPHRGRQDPSTYHNPQDYVERAIQTAVQMIESAEMGTRHHTRLKAARLLGGYVAGGLLSEAHAYGTLAQALVGHTKDLERALKTVEDGLAYGKAHPITVDTLEIERQVWLDQQFARNRLNPMNRDGQGAPERPPSDPPKGRQTLSVRRYTGYTGYRPYRGYSQEGTCG
jgi:hypothetical protein